MFYVIGFILGCTIFFAIYRVASVYRFRKYVQSMSDQHSKKRNPFSEWLNKTSFIQMFFAKSLNVDDNLEGVWNELQEFRQPIQKKQRKKKAKPQRQKK